MITENHMPRGGFAKLSCKGHVLAMGQFLIAKEDHPPLQECIANFADLNLAKRMA